MKANCLKGNLSLQMSFCYVFKNENINTLKKGLKGSEFDALVHIPADVLENPKNIKIYSEKGVTLELQSRVENAIEKEIETIKLTEAGITKSVLESAKMGRCLQKLSA